MRQYVALFRNRNFLLHWLAGAISNIGDFFNSLALVKLLSEDPAHLGLYMSLIMVSKVLPGMLLGPVAGAVADRLPRRAVMVVSDLLRAALVLALVFVDQPAAILALVFGAAVVGTFFNPASSAMLPSLVEKEQLVTAGSLRVMTERTAMLLGNGIGAAVLIAVGPHNVFYLDAASYVVSALLLLFMAVPTVVRPPKESRSVLGGFVADMKETIAFLRQTPAVRHLITGLAIANIADAGLSVLLVPFFTLTLGIAAESIGFVWAAFGATSVLGALLLGVVGRKIHWSHLLTYGTFYVYFMGLGFVLAGRAIPSVTFLVLLGLGSGAANVAIQAAVGELVPDQVRGRIFGTWGMVNSLIYTLGVVTAGPLADRFGPTATLLAYSTAFLVTGLYSFWAFRGRQAKPAVEATTGANQAPSPADAG